MLHGSKENSMLVKRLAACIPIYLQPFLKYSSGGSRGRGWVAPIDLTNFCINVKSAFWDDFLRLCKNWSGQWGPPTPATWIRHCCISEMVEDRWVHAARRLTSIEFSFDPCNIYCNGPRGVGYPADARSVGDSHPSCRFMFSKVFQAIFPTCCNRLFF